MPTPLQSSPAPSSWPARWQRFSAACVRGFHSYANWLVGVTWKRFVVLSLLLLVVSGLLQNIPPFSWTYTRTVPNPVLELPTPPATPATPTAPPSPAEPSAKPGIRIERPAKPGHPEGLEIVIDERGVRITPRAKSPEQAASGASASGASAASTAASVASGSAQFSAPASAAAERPLVDIHLPPGATSDVVKAAVEEARQAVEEALRDASDDARQASRDAADASRDVAREAKAAAKRQRSTVHEVSLGEFLPTLAMLWIVASVIIKITYKQQIKAQAQAAQAIESAEAEALKRQVLEARMAAMQAQVEPHFLFNTLASIDHLIEVDPPRASQMQKHLIALLRVSMPTMREANNGGVGLGKSRDLGRELLLIRPYLEILKMRMEERLSTEIDLPEGLLSAEFPPMMLQTLVENAIKHGLEPKAEGGHLRIKAEIVHGKLAVTVSDTGLGFGRAVSTGTTAGTGVGLANIRERLQLLYGPKASLTVTENPGGGTRVTLAMPYKPVEDAAP